MEGLEAAAAAFFACPTRLSGRRFSTKSPRRHRGRFVPMRQTVRARRGVDGGDLYGGGRPVDEGMIVLRMRIREMKMSEKNHVLPSGWMEWEKKYYEHYNEDVCEAVGWLQSVLMDTRPCLALGMVALIALSLPFSTYVVILHAIEVAKGVSSGFLPSM